jgi:hypothetical protein
MTEGTKTLLERIDDLDTEIIEIKKNTNRWVKILCELLLPLFKEYAEAKKAYISHKTSYEMDYIEKKEERERQIIQFNEWTEDEKKKIKITWVELDKYADSALKNNYQEMQGYKEIEVYLEPVINGYMNYINGVKYDWNNLTPVNKFNEW